MRGKTKLLSGVAAVFLLALPGRAQTAVWTGGGSNTNFSNGGNWMAGSPPPNDGTNTVDLDYASSGTIAINSSANVAGIVFQGPPEAYSQYNWNDAGGTLTIGAGGISYTSVSGANLYFNANIVLSQNQTWSLGFMNQGTGVISGPGSLTTTGSDYIFGNNTFSGGLNIESGTYYLGTGSSAGTGTITVADGAALDTYYEPVTLSNPLVLGSSVSFGTGASNPLTLTGPVTLQNASSVINLSNNTQVFMTGPITGPSSTTLTISGNAPTLPIDGGSQLVLQGALSQVTGLAVTNAQLILAPTGNPSTSYAGLLATGVQVGQSYSSTAYLGLDGAFATTSGAVASFISTYGPSLGSTISGSLGFDTTASPTTPQTFSDPIDLTDFSSPYFQGLGSATSAILTGSITPTPDNVYLFGGGGGTLTVQSNLADFDGTTLRMIYTQEPLTLIVQGANNYTGGVVSNGGVLIFDSAVLPTGGISLAGGYVGYTEVPALSSAAFIALFNNYGEGVIGFDQHTPNPSLPRQIGDTINLSGFNGDSSIFLGTATNAELTAGATITPANNNYQFTGVKGGNLTIDTQLTDDGDIPNSVTLGLITPIESNGSTSVINITGNNTYSGGTTYNSGTVFVNSSTAFGTGPITISDTSGADISPYLASYGGSPVTIMNPISVGAIGSSQGVTLGNLSPSGNDMLVLGGVISDNPETGPGMIAIGGPVTLSAANTYSGGTIFTGNGSAEALITNSSAFGTGQLTIQDGATIAPLGANVTLGGGNSIDLDGSPLNLGQNGNAYTLTLNGAITGNGTLNIYSTVALNGGNTYSGNTVIDAASVIIGSTTPFGTSSVTLQNGSSLEYSTNSTILDLSGDSSNSIVLAPEAVLTLDADSNNGNYMGTISGNASNSLIKVDVGTQYLYGTATYGGGTTVAAGTLVAGSSGALGTGTVTVGSGAELAVASGAALTIPVALGTGASLGGTGSFSGTFTFANGSQVLPGNQIPGQYTTTLSFANDVTFGSGGTYGFNVATASGVAGTDYTTLAIAGTLTIAGGPFTIAVQSIDPGSGSPGLASFTSTQNYSWTLLTAASGISGFNPTYFLVDTSQFQNSLGGGSFSVGEAGDTLTLDFTPVPEPSTWILMLAGLAAAGAGMWRSKLRLAVRARVSK
jgi:fibronectin-binding autotransporter adhesin